MPSLRFILIRCLITPLAFLPLRWSQFIGSYLGLALIKHNKKRANIALDNIQACFPNKSTDEHKALLKKTAMEAGKWFMESPYIWFRPPQYFQQKVNVANPELLEEAHQKGRGVVLVLPHQGNWELLNYYAPLHYPFGAMYRPSNSPLMEEIIFSGRSRLGSAMFAANTRGVRQALKALKKNTVIAILSDHLPSEDAGVYAPFFGHPALTGKLTHSLVKYNQSEILLTSVVREQKGEGFTIHFEKIEGMDTDDSVEAATIMNQAIEKSILLAPEQYQWVYRRFAKPPTGVKSIYRDT